MEEPTPKADDKKPVVLAPPIEINAGKLWTIYRENPAKADSEYTGNRVRIPCHGASVTKTEKGYAIAFETVTGSGLGAQMETPGVYCHVREEDRKSLNNPPKNWKGAYAIGIVRGMTKDGIRRGKIAWADYRVDVDDCEIVLPADAAKTAK